MSEPRRLSRRRTMNHHEEDEHFRRLDIQFLALLRSSTLAELMGLERLEENQLPWRQAALSRAIWRAMLR